MVCRVNVAERGSVRGSGGEGVWGARELVGDGEWWRSLLLGACVCVCVCEQASLLMNPEDKVWVVIKSGT